MGVKSRKPHLILHKIIRDNVEVDKNMIPDDLEKNFVHPWKLKVSKICYKKVFVLNILFFYFEIFILSKVYWHLITLIYT